MTRIWERLFVGSLADAERLSRKNPNRIAMVICLNEQSVESKAVNVSYFHLPVEDDEPVPVRQFEAVMKAIAESVRTGNVLVHCGVGISRAPTMTAAYMHRVGYADFKVAMREVEQKRPIIEPSEILVKSVKELL